MFGQKNGNFLLSIFMMSLMATPSAFACGGSVFPISVESGTMKGMSFSILGGGISIGVPPKTMYVDYGLNWDMNPNGSTNYDSHHDRWQIQPPNEGPYLDFKQTPWTASEGPPFANSADSGVLPIYNDGGKIVGGMLFNGKKLEIYEVQASDLSADGTKIITSKQGQAYDPFHPAGGKPRQPMIILSVDTNDRDLASVSAAFFSSTGRPLGLIKNAETGTRSGGGDEQITHFNSSARGLSCGTGTVGCGAKGECSQYSSTPGANRPAKLIDKSANPNDPFTQ